MKQVFISKGNALVKKVPAPKVEPGTVLVEVDHSCISVGTEMSGLYTSSLPIWRRAVKQPENVKKVFRLVSEQGIGKTRKLVESRLSADLPTGYSAAGTVMEVGNGVSKFQPGDRVACAGAQCAYHAEIIRVPLNLTLPIPEGLSFAEASTVTLGAIALQGVRRASPTLGETFVVLGLGVLGQLTTQILTANGCRVIGTDLDRTRIERALNLGMNAGLHPEDENDLSQVSRLTDGNGADAVIITAANPSDEIISTAFNMCRKKGRVVLVGDVGLKLNREDFYAKEIDFFISSSYGPGRYDQRYEEKGLDYPLPYVRWTENRNMLEYLRLIKEKKVLVGSLIDSTYPLEKAKKAFEILKSEKENPLVVLLSYPGQHNRPPLRKVSTPKSEALTSRKIRIAIIGAGSFAQSTHLPNLVTLKKIFDLRYILNRTGYKAVSLANQFGANYATTDLEEVMSDKEVEAVLISTRHNTHADLVLQGLKAGKHVLVEKPLVLNEVELESIDKFFGDNVNSTMPILLTGFNRRFSPMAQRMKKLLIQRTNPMIINYRMNAGHIPMDHWVHSEEGGGRNLGEACHIYDLFTFFTDSSLKKIQAYSLRPSTENYSSSDNFIVNILFNDGSLAHLTYSSLGSKSFPKEVMEIYCDGKVYLMEDYKKLEIRGSKIKPYSTSAKDKGHLEEIKAFASSIKTGLWEIPWWQQKQVMEICFAVEKLI